MKPEELKKILSPRDKQMLDATNGTSWVPNDPAEVLYAYIKEEDTKPEQNSIDDRRKKAKEVYKGYEKLEKDCVELESKIADRCKNVTVDINESDNLSIIQAVKRVFGTDGKQITFQMYQKCIEELSKSTNATIPKVGKAK